MRFGSEFLIREAIMILTKIYTYQCRSEFLFKKARIMIPDRFLFKNAKTIILKNRGAMGNFPGGAPSRPDGPCIRAEARRVRKFLTRF